MGSGKDRRILITGGAGFIGSNLAERLLADPRAEVTVFDDLSRGGVQHNVDWLRSLPTASRLTLLRGDVRDAAAVAEAAHHATEIYHLAAQVAVTTSVFDPGADFHTNALGTFNILEAARRSGRKPFLLFTSTNKVYGSLHGVPVRPEGTHYAAADPGFHGVSEDEPLDFHSPYGCSKGAADQYVRDYARIYQLPTVVFRMSCIAGPRQYGNEDQGWVAHFLYSVLEGAPITVYGDGLQVRDVLHVSDLLDAITAARDHQTRTAGQIYNVGGGLERSISVSEMLSAIERHTGRKPNLRSSAVRPGDQPLYISDTARLSAHTGWQPTRSLADTLDSIHAFYQANGRLIRQHRASSQKPELIAEEVA